MTEYLRFVSLIKKELYGAIFGIFMSFIATFSSIALMGTATWFLSAMAVCGFYDVVLNIFIPSALIRLLALSRTLLRYGERYYTHDATFRLIAYLRVFLFERALDLKIEDALKLKSSDLQRRMQVDLERLEMIYIRQFVPFVCATLMGLVVGFVLISFSWLMAFTALSLMFFAGVALPIFLTRLAQEHSLKQSTLAVRLNDDMSDFIHGFFDLMLLGKHVSRAQEFLTTAKELAAARARIIFFDQLAQVFLLTLSELTFIFLLIQGVPLVVAGEMSSPQMMLLSVSAMASFEVLVPLSAAFLNLPYVTHSAKRVSALLKITDTNADLNPRSYEMVKDTSDDPISNIAQSSIASQAAAGGSLSRFSSFKQQESKVDTNKPLTGDSFAFDECTCDEDTASVQQTSQAEAVAQQSAKLESALESHRKVNVVKLQDVYFAYEISEGQQLQVLDNCSLSFKSNENYVIKAPSGRGKSTLVLLLTSLLYPQKGELYLNDEPYANLKARDIRANFAVALQDITLFSGTIFETFRQVKPKVSRDEVLAALAIVELTDLVAQLPNGLDEWLGSTGLTISGGQARRLCLARALVAADAVMLDGSSEQNQANSDNDALPAHKFLVLDEPGEGLDEAQEVRIIERIQSLRKGVIIITHKNAGSRLADHIVNF